MRRNKKKYMIIGLIVAVFVMSAAYAAFATQLNINSTASFTSSWHVHFDKTACTSYSDQTGCAGATTIEPGISGGLTPTGTLTYGSGDRPLTAQVTADLKQPGDTIEYRLTIKNTGDLIAQAGTPTLSGNGFTIDGLTALTASKHLRFTVYPSDQTILEPGESTVMRVVAEFSDYTAADANLNLDESSSETGNMAAEGATTLQITLNYSQVSTSGSGTITNQTVYAFNTTNVTVGTSTLSDLVSTVTSQPYYRSASAVMNASGRTAYNKYKVVNNVITEAYVCHTYGVLSTPVCLRGGDSSYYSSNQSVLTSLSNNSEFTSAGGTCTSTACTDSTTGLANVCVITPQGNVVAVINTNYTYLQAGLQVLTSRSEAYCSVSGSGLASCRIL